MLTTPHLVLGAAIGANFDKAIYVVPIAAASHFLLDSIPHLQGYIEVEDLDKKDIFLLFADALVGVMLVAILAFNSAQTELIILGAFSAYLPDFHHIYQVIFGSDKLDKYNRIHRKFHWKRDMRILPGMATQIVVAVLSVLSIIRK